MCREIKIQGLIEKLDNHRGLLEICRSIRKQINYFFTFLNNLNLIPYLLRLIGIYHFTRLIAKFESLKIHCIKIEDTKFDHRDSLNKVEIDLTINVNIKITGDFNLQNYSPIMTINLLPKYKLFCVQSPRPLNKNSFAYPFQNPAGREKIRPLTFANTNISPLRLAASMQKGGGLKSHR